MKPANQIRRRRFLGQASGSIGLALLGLGARGGISAETAGLARKNAAAIEKLIDELDAKGAEFWSVPKKDGQFLHFLVKAMQAKKVLEIGTSHGFSAIWISLALEETGGTMTTIEILPDRVALAKKHVAEAGLSHRVTFKEGDAHKVLPGLPGPFDFVFIDAEKEGQVDYFNKLYPAKLAPGGVLVAHNAIRYASSMRDYLDLVQGHEEFDTVFVSATMDDGLALSYRKRL